MNKKITTNSIMKSRKFDDIQAIQSAITRITMEERIKELHKLRAHRKWQEENSGSLQDLFQWPGLGIDRGSHFELRRSSSKTLLSPGRLPLSSRRCIQINLSCGIFFIRLSFLISLPLSGLSQSRRVRCRSMQNSPQV